MSRLTLICALVSLTGPVRAGPLAETREGAAVRGSRNTIVLEVIAPPIRTVVSAEEFLDAARKTAQSWNPGCGRGTVFQKNSPRSRLTAA